MVRQLRSALRGSSAPASACGEGEFGRRSLLAVCGGDESETPGETVRMCAGYSTWPDKTQQRARVPALGGPSQSRLQRIKR